MSFPWKRNEVKEQKPCMTDRAEDAAETNVFVNPESHQHQKRLSLCPVTKHLNQITWTWLHYHAQHQSLKQEGHALVFNQIKQNHKIKKKEWKKSQFLKDIILQEVTLFLKQQHKHQ